MCKKIKGCGRKIDKCMVSAIWILKNRYKVNVISCCCGHKRYPMSIVINDKQGIYELFSEAEIPRKTRFYKRDKKGFYYIPEAIA